MTPRLRASLLSVVLLTGVVGVLVAQQPRIYWGDEVPAGWAGKWSAELGTVPERTRYTRTMSTLQMHEWIAALKLRSENVHVVRMFTSPLGKVAPAIVLGSPRVTSPQEARESGKPVVFLMGNIHPPEPEAAEALLMVARDLAAGPGTHILNHLVVMIAPIYNVDGTDTFVTQDGGFGSETPYILGVRQNSQGLDLNREGVKLVSVEANGLYRTFNDWDPILFLDGHLMSRVSHGYANTYGTATIPASAPGPRAYMTHTLLPAVRDLVRKDFGLEVFTHALATPDTWPPQAWSHERAAWTVEAKMVVNDFGLRNRLAIITETPGQPTFERRIYAQYAYITALLEYAAAHAKDMQAVVKKADDETVAAVLAGAESGTLTNFLDGEYQSAGKIDLLAYRKNEPHYRPGTSVLGTKPGTASGPPEVVRNVDDLTKPVGTRSGRVPRAYILPARLADVAAKLRVHNIRVTTLDKPVRVEGEQFTIDRMYVVPRFGYDMTTLDGSFSPIVTKEFPAGSFYVDMAQPMANATFYYLEPQARDGFVGWGVLDDELRGLGADQRPVVYPIFKVRRTIQ
ncbi:MAG: M14 family zinc carboxypeptidase [Acidobacteriota bacterium]